MPKHSVEIKDLKISFDGKNIYDPLPPQMRFHQSPAKYRLFGGSAGGGKSYGIIGEAIMRSMKYEFPTVGCIFRRSFPELDATVIRTMLDILPTWFYKYNQSQHIMTLKNGSLIEFCYSESDADVTRYQSREWDWIGIDELTHFTEFQWTYLMSRMRTTKPINTKFFGATNPGGRGHSWVRDRWVKKICADDNYDPKEYDFVPAGVIDNPYIMNNNPDYIEQLKMLPESERKALLYGDWDIFEGMFFTEWSPTRHIVAPFDIPGDWKIIMGVDDGTAAPRSVHLYAIDKDRRVWCIWEYYKAGENLPDAANNIKRKLQEDGYWDRIHKCVVDPSMKRVDSHTGITSVELLENMGFGFKAGSIELGNNNRVDGWRIMKSYLMHKPYEEPMLKYFNTCGNIIRTIPQLTYYQARGGRASKKEDLDCFIKGIKIDTLTGKKNVEDIKLGDYVRTPIGFQRVIKDGISGLSYGTSWIELSNGQKLEGTKNHKIFIEGKGLVELQNASVGDTLQSRNIYLWKQKKSGIRGYYIVDILVVGIIVQMVAILKKVTPRFIGKCISIIMERFQRAWRYTTRIVTEITIVHKILNFLKTEYTANSTLSKEKIYKRNLENGEILKKERKPSEITQERCLKEHQKYPVRAAIVESLLEQRKSSRNIALKNVSTFIEYLSRNLKGVKFVEKISKRLIKVLSPVRITVVGSCVEEKIVYNLTVENANLYYANGVLVTNTSQEDHAADDNRYMLMSLEELPSRFGGSGSNIEVVKREYKPKSS